MGAIALLVDWENVRLGLQNIRRAYNPAQLAQELNRTAIERARQLDPSAYMAASLAFAPARGFDTQTTVGITNNGMTVVMTEGSDQAADLAVAIRAMQLFFRAEEPVRCFFIVSNDSDFLPLHNELNRGGSVCHMWLVDKSNASRAAAKVDRAAYLTELFDIPRDESSTDPSDLEVYLVQCQRLLDQGIHLGGIDLVRQKIVALNVFDDSTAGQLWTTATRARLIGDLPGYGQNGRYGNARRLAYETEAVMRTIWPSELLVWAVSRERKHRFHRGEALDVVRRPELLAALERSGCLIDTGDGYIPGDGTTRYGMVGAGLRVALSFYAVKSQGQESMGMGQLIKSHWPRFFKPGGNLAETEREQSAEDAKAAVGRSIVMRMAARVQHTRPDGGKASGIIIDEKHPLVRLLRDRLNRAVTELMTLGATADERIRLDDFVGHMASLSRQPWTRVETDYWIGMMAAERVVTLRAGELTLNKSRLRDEIAAWA